MFKKGQVWRNNFSGNLYLVVRTPKKHLCDVICIAGSYLMNGGGLGSSAARTSYTLIGNNYKERPTTQAQPGDVFKRWFGDLPEQRGCRKEDC